MQADRVFREVDRVARQREQRLVWPGAVDQRIEEVRRNLGCAAEERQVGMDDADHQRALSAACRNRFECVEREIGIARQAVLDGIAVRARGDELHDCMQSRVFGQVARDVRVVGTRVTTLRLPGMHHRAGLEVELLDLHVRRKPVHLEVRDVVEARIVGAELTREERLRGNVVRARCRPRAGPATARYRA